MVVWMNTMYKLTITKEADTHPTYLHSIQMGELIWQSMFGRLIEQELIQADLSLNSSKPLLLIFVSNFVVEIFNTNNWTSLVYNCKERI